MEYETYEDVIDAYNSGVGVEPGDSLTDYIKKNNIRIKEIEMSPLDDLKKVAKKANGGIMRENYARGSMDQESGIMKLDEAKMLAYEPGDYNKDKYDPAMVDEYEKYKYDMQEQRPGMPIMTIDEFIRMEMKDISKKRKAPSIKMAEADFDPLMDEYMKYLDEMKEIDKPPMSLREFEAEARLGVRGGGLAYLMGM
tara:strand:+ start:208 stop:795 length:588 start_codon:yes stop_codon:yes gene_type:complete